MNIKVIEFPVVVVQGSLARREYNKIAKRPEHEGETVKVVVDLPAEGRVLGFAFDAWTSDCEWLTLESLTLLPAVRGAGIASALELLSKGSIPGLIMRGALPSGPDAQEPSYTPFAESFQLTGQREAAYIASNTSEKDARASAFLVLAVEAAG